MVNSMTAFATRRGGFADFSWVWDLRGVNARGLDLKLRLPEGIDGLEAAVRAAIAPRIARGSLALSLRVQRESAAAPVRLDEAQMQRILEALARVAEAAAARGLALAPASAAEVLALRGVLEAGAAPEEDPVLPHLLPDLARLLDDFVAMRAAEGRALAAVLADQLAGVARLTEAARAAALARADQAAEAFRLALARILDAVEVDPQRVAQELALLAVKADVTEELDRLEAHVAAARALLAEGGAVGRKLDFLMQEFNREANTLCSKAGAAELTRIGLDLKAAIEQMREQIQNVE
jgi:uncharacterized protein (TIGR00255 family)